MEDIIERPLKELFAAIFHTHQKQNSSEIRSDQEKVLNELLNQPPNFKNRVLLTEKGLEVYTQKEDMYYRHADSLESREIVRKIKAIK